MKADPEDIWVGLSKVSASASVKFEAFNCAGAFVWWAATATDASDFRSKVEEATTHYGLVLVELTEVGPACERLGISHELFELVHRAEEDSRWILYGTFHKYPHHEA